MTKKDWTEQLRERLADYEADAPEGLWADIERRLTQQPTSVVVPPQQKSTVTPLWRRWSGPRNKRRRNRLQKKSKHRTKRLQKRNKHKASLWQSMRRSLESHLSVRDGLRVRSLRKKSSLPTEKKFALIKQTATSYLQIMPLLTTKQRQSGLRFGLSLSAPRPSPRLPKTARALPLASWLTTASWPTTTPTE